MPIQTATDLLCSAECWTDHPRRGFRLSQVASAGDLGIILGTNLSSLGENRFLYVDLRAWVPIVVGIQPTSPSVREKKPLNRIALRRWDVQLCRPAADATLWELRDLPPEARPLLESSATSAGPEAAVVENGLLDLCDTMLGPELAVTGPSPLMRLTPEAFWVDKDGLYLLGAGWFRQTGGEECQARERERFYAGALSILCRKIVRAQMQRLGVPQEAETLLPAELRKDATCLDEVRQVLRRGMLRLDGRDLALRWRLLCLTRLLATQPDSTGAATGSPGPLEQAAEILRPLGFATNPVASIEEAMQRIEQLFPATWRLLHQTRAVLALCARSLQETRNQLSLQTSESERLEATRLQLEARLAGANQDRAHLRVVLHETEDSLEEEKQASERLRGRIASLENENAYLNQRNTELSGDIARLRQRLGWLVDHD